MTAGNRATASTLNLEKIRSDFPILNQTVNGQSLVYLDNGLPLRNLSP